MEIDGNPLQINGKHVSFSLSWQGELIGSAADFVQKVCIEQFGIQDPPQVTDPMFKDIAAENLKQVKMQLQRVGAPKPLELWKIRVDVLAFRLKTHEESIKIDAFSRILGRTEGAGRPQQWGALFARGRGGSGANQMELKLQFLRCFLRVISVNCYTR